MPGKYLNDYSLIRFREKILFFQNQLILSKNGIKFQTYQNKNKIKSCFHFLYVLFHIRKYYEIKIELEPNFTKKKKNYKLFN